MRVTQKMMSSNFTASLQKNLQRMQKAQGQLTSGDEISRPSDDPYLVTRSLDLRNSVRINEQYQKNIENSTGWVDANDNSLSALSDSVNRVRELVVRGSNTNLDEQTYMAIRVEIEQLTEGIGDLINANYDGRYIFGGNETTKAPVPRDYAQKTAANIGESYQGDGASLKREVIEGVSLTINITGDEIMQIERDPATGEITKNGLQETLKDITDTLKYMEDPQKLDGKISELSVKIEELEAAGDTSSDTYLALTAEKDELVDIRDKELGEEYLTELDDHFENILTLRNKNGATRNRLDTLLDRNKTENIEMSSLLSEVEDVDFAEKITEYLMLEGVYKASLSTGARIMQPSLLDYI